MLRIIACLLALCMIAACTNPNDLDEAPAYLGNFQLGHNVVVAPNLTKGPVSRNATDEELITALKTTIGDRFERYQADRLYHLGISIEGYVLARPGIPIVASPKSALIVNVTAWDDEAGIKLNEKPHLVTSLETLSTKVFLGSGLTQTREKQLENLTKNTSKLIQNWLVEQNNQFGWFEDDKVPAKNKPAWQKKTGLLVPKESIESIPNDEALLEGDESALNADAEGSLTDADAPVAEVIAEDVIRPRARPQ